MDPIRFYSVWRIENFTETFGNMTGQPAIYSEEHHPVDQSEFKFRVLLYPNGSQEKSKDHVAVYVNLTAAPQSEVKAIYRIAILDQDWNGKHIRGWAFLNSKGPCSICL